MDDDNLIPDPEEMDLINQFRPQLYMAFPPGLPPQNHAPPRLARQNLIRREPVARVKWIFGFIPLPIVNYALLWRRNRPHNLRHSLSAIALSFCTIILRILRWLLYFLSLGNYARNALSLFITLASSATFSENSLSDIYSYILRDSLFLLDRRAAIVFGLAGTTEKSFFQFLVDKLALQLNGMCLVASVEGSLLDDEKRMWCNVKQDTLIFRFSRAIESKFSMPAPLLTSVTVFIYVAYGLLAQVVGFNVIFFFILLMGYRMNRFLPFFKRFSQSAWKGLLDSVF